MKSTRKLLLGAAVACLAFGVTGSMVYAQTELKMAYGLQHDSFQGDVAAAFKSELERLSAGSITVSTIPSYMGGNDRAIIESVQLGTIDVSFTSTAVAESFVQGTAVLDLPFIIRDVEHAKAIQEGPVGDEILARYEAGGLIGIALTGADFRNVTTGKLEVRKASDLQGVKIRTMQSDVPLAAFRAIGAQPVPIAFSELYTALQTGTVDAQENPVSVMFNGRLFEVQKYMSRTRHMFNNSVLLTSPEVWGRLSEQERGWMREAGKKAAEAQRKRILADEENYLAQMVAAGLTVIDDVDVASLRAAVEPAYAEYEKVFGKDLIERIRSVE